MTSHRIRVDLPAALQSDADVALFARRLAASLMPELASGLDTVSVADQHGSRDVWLALAWQPDGTSVSLTIDRGEKIVGLDLETRGLQPPLPPPSLWVHRAGGGILVASGALGLLLRSFWIGLGFAVLSFVVWIGIDIRHQVVVERRRTIDIPRWEERFAEAVRKSLEDLDAR